MTRARYLVGDVFEVMAEIPDGSVDLIMTSPPFYRLRSYLPDGHPDKAKEIGSEATPADFLDTLLALTAEWGRVLAPHGSICVELGDTYAGSGGGGGDYYENGLRAGQPGFTGSAGATRDQLREANARHWREKNIVPPGPEDKSLLGIPDAYALSLEYGWNVLRRNAPDSPAGKWRVRNKVAWVRPNPPVGALGDKFRPATSYLTIACRARDRWFDLDAVRTVTDRHARDVALGPGKHGDMGHEPARNHNHGRAEYTNGGNPAGAPPLDWWNIPPTGYPGAHYAVYPPELCVRPILAMCPRRVCTTCGQPSRRIVETANGTGRLTERHPTTRGRGDGEANAWVQATGMTSSDRRTLGWSDCGHNSWRAGHVLDPFAGTGTTLAVATGHGREATGIDLDPRNAELAQQRLGMFLDIHDNPTTEPAA